MSFYCGTEENLTTDKRAQGRGRDEVSSLTLEPISDLPVTPPSEEHNSHLADEYCKACDGRPGYNCASCICHVCSNKTDPRQRFVCFVCGKIYHEWCRINKEVDNDNRWLCSQCTSARVSLKMDDGSGAPALANEKVSTAPTRSPSSVNEIDRKTLSRNSFEDCDDTATTAERFFHNMISDPAKTAKMLTVRKMHNCGRRTKCEIVPPNHFGPVPGIEVGTCWKFRVQVSESGVHRPLVAGIHGREGEGAYSIVLSGVYSEDQDNGEEFYYSGCGGRLSDPTKRFSQQIVDQELRRHNRALAVCCSAPLNEEDGAEAVNWRTGKPVRVIRNYKLRKVSPYAPEEGNRYDGIYKVVKYFPYFGKNGLKVWRYLLRRDDPTPAPWTEEGKRRISTMRLKMLLPENDGICESLEKKNIERMVPKRNKLIKRKRKKRVCRRPSETEADVKTVAEHDRETPLSSSEDELPDRWSSWYEPASATTASDLDVKPNVHELASLSRQYVSGQHIFDKKPDVGELNLQLYRSSQSNLNRHSDSDAEDCLCAPQICITKVMSSHIEIDEDVKPNVRVLNEAMAQDDSVTSDKSKILTALFNVNPDSITGHSVDESSPQFFPLPLINSICSLASGGRNHENVDEATQSTAAIQFPDSGAASSPYHLHDLRPMISSPAIPSSPSSPAHAPNSPPPPSPPPPMNIKINSVCSAGAAYIDNNVKANSAFECTRHFELPPNVMQMMDRDVSNKAAWQHITMVKTKEDFVSRLKDAFSCPCCNQFVQMPVTTSCAHNICWNCLRKHFSEQKMYSCPECNQVLESSYCHNELLDNILQNLTIDYYAL